MAKKNVKTKAKSAPKPAKSASKPKSVGKIAKAVKAVKAVAAKLSAKTKPVKAVKPAKQSEAKLQGKNVKVEIQAVAKSVKSAVSVKGGKIKVTETEIVAVAVQTKGGKAAAGKKADKAQSAPRGKSLANSCREITCDLTPTSAGYCRAHYIKNWKKIKRKEAVLKDGKLNQYVEELISKYPEKYIEAIRFDLANDKEFMKVIRDLELDEAIDDVGGDDSEAPEAVAVEGVGTGRRGADLDDDSDIF